MPQEVTCQISGEKFTVSDHEIRLRTHFGFTDLPTILPKYRLQQLGAFYPNWGLYKRNCDKTGVELISTFTSNCPYPVWKRQEWFKHANPPFAKIDFNKPFFEQAKELFFRCPIPHIFQFQCENCEYTDDWYESKNCYLCHGGDNSENVRYSAHVNSCKDSICSTVIYNCQWCFDCINCRNTFRCVHCLDVRDSHDCTFCYDCRNSRDCIFCFNLRSKQYCVGNVQLTREQYESERKKWKFETRSGYKKAQAYFIKMMKEISWLRATYIEHSENSSGNYIQHMKDCESCFMELDHENCCHGLWSGGSVKHICEGVGTYGCHGGYKVAMPIKCFEIRCSFMCFECKFSDYLGYCVGCENSFGCCGLHKKNYCILNTPYSKQEFGELQKRLIDHMKSTGEWGEFFPGDFAPNTYEDSLSATFWPLDETIKKKFSFRISENVSNKLGTYKSSIEVPDSPFDAGESITKNIYWDERSEKPFTILPQDINFCRELAVPLPNSHYVRKIYENLAWMPYNGELRNTICGKSGTSIQTSWPAEYDGRIVGEEAYLKLIG